MQTIALPPASFTRMAVESTVAGSMGSEKLMVITASTGTCVADTGGSTSVTTGGSRSATVVKDQFNVFSNGLPAISFNVPPTLTPYNLINSSGYFAVEAQLLNWMADKSM